MSNINVVTFLAFLGAFSLGLILGNAGNLGELGAVLKEEYAPCPPAAVEQGEASTAFRVRIAVEATNNTRTNTNKVAVTDGVQNSTSIDVLNGVTESGVANSSLSEKLVLRGTVNVTEETIITDDHSTARADATVVNENSTVVNENDEDNPIKKDGICSLLYQKLGVSFSASQVWTSRFLDILAASQHPADPKFLHKDWTMSLLASLTPEMLQRGLRTRPYSQAFNSVLELVRQRILNPESSPPVKIAVVGGSVTQGGGCSRPPVEVDGYEDMKDATGCAWPRRFEHLINTLMGTEIVKVYNLAVGGTNLELATPLIKYWLYPDFLLPDGPDVIISSYSTNEQHTYPYRIDTTNTTAFATGKRRRVNDFISAVHNSRPCDEPPFLIFLDDYLGNQQDRILGETTYNKVVTELAEWYGDVMHVSYADAVRRVVYADTEETIFTPAWPIVEKGELAGQQKVEPHFGMGGHMTIAWALVYAIAQALAGFCENEMFVEEMARMKRPTMIPHQVTELMSAVPPPRLTTDLMLSNVTQAWQQNAREWQRNRQATCSDDTFGKAPCLFAFIAGPAGTVRNSVQLRRYLKPYTVENDGWVPVVDLAAGGWSRKLGLVASKDKATLTLKLTNIEKEIRTVNLQTLKSYGEKWEGSKARFTLKVQHPGKSEWADTFDIEGFHDSKTR